MLEVVLQQECYVYSLLVKLVTPLVLRSNGMHIIYAVMKTFVVDEVVTVLSHNLKKQKKEFFRIPLT